jgi:hypothetical protein
MSSFYWVFGVFRGIENKAAGRVQLHIVVSECETTIRRMHPAFNSQSPADR